MRRFVSYSNSPTCDVSTHFVICNEYREERRMEGGDLEYPIKITAFYFSVPKERKKKQTPSSKGSYILLYSTPTRLGWQQLWRHCEAAIWPVHPRSNSGYFGWKGLRGFASSIFFSNESLSSRQSAARGFGCVEYTYSE